MPSSTLSSPKVSVSLSGTLSGGATPAPATSSVNHNASTSPTVGTSAGQADRLYSAALTVSNGTPLLIDLTALTDSLGNAVNLTGGHVLFILVTNNSTTVGQDITVGGASSNPLIASETDPVHANGGFFCVGSPNEGWAVDSTHKILQVTAAAGTNVPFALSILGRST